ncbi:unnamed protein product [Scytosiphon promiscuus]
MMVRLIPSGTYRVLRRLVSCPVDFAAFVTSRRLEGGGGEVGLECIIEGDDRPAVSSASPRVSLVYFFFSTFDMVGSFVCLACWRVNRQRAKNLFSLSGFASVLYSTARECLVLDSNTSFASCLSCCFPSVVVGAEKYGACTSILVHRALWQETTQNDLWTCVCFKYDVRGTVLFV